MESNESIYQAALSLYQDCRDKEALELLEDHLLERSVDAYLLLGEIYENPNTGSGVKRDVKKTIKYWETALSLSSGEAAYRLGLLYDLGQGVKSSSKKSIAYWKLGWKNGSALSAFELAKVLIDKCTEINTALGALTFLLGDNKLAGTACFYLSKIYLNEDSGYYNISEGLSYLEKGCSLGKVTCCMKLAELYWFGKRIAKDSDKALHFITQAKLCKDNLFEDEIARFEKIVKAGS